VDRLAATEARGETKSGQRTTKSERGLVKERPKKCRNPGTGEVKSKAALTTVMKISTQEKRRPTVETKRSSKIKTAQHN
jgi:hypothetical protein